MVVHQREQLLVRALNCYGRIQPLRRRWSNEPALHIGELADASLIRQWRREQVKHAVDVNAASIGCGDKHGSNLSRPVPGCTNNHYGCMEDNTHNADSPNANLRMKRGVGGSIGPQDDDKFATR